MLSITNGMISHFQLALKCNTYPTDSLNDLNALVRANRSLSGALVIYHTITPNRQMARCTLDSAFHGLSAWQIYKLFAECDSDLSRYTPMGISRTIICSGDIYTLVENRLDQFIAQHELGNIERSSLCLNDFLFGCAAAVELNRLGAEPAAQQALHLYFSEYFSHLLKRLQRELDECLNPRSREPPVDLPYIEDFFGELLTYAEPCRQAVEQIFQSLLEDYNECHLEQQQDRRAKPASNTGAPAKPLTIEEQARAHTSLFGPK